MAPILTSLMNIYIQLGISGCIKVGNKLTDKKKTDSSAVYFVPYCVEICVFCLLTYP